MEKFLWIIWGSYWDSGGNPLQIHDILWLDLFIWDARAARAGRCASKSSSPDDTKIIKIQRGNQTSRKHQIYMNLYESIWIYMNLYESIWIYCIQLYPVVSSSPHSLQTLGPPIPVGSSCSCWASSGPPRSWIRACSRVISRFSSWRSHHSTVTNRRWSDLYVTSGDLLWFTVTSQKEFSGKPASNLLSLLFFISSNSFTLASSSSTLSSSSSTPVLARTRWTRVLDSAFAFMSSKAFCDSDTFLSAAASFSSHSRRSFSISSGRTSAEQGPGGFRIKIHRNNLYQNKIQIRIEPLNHYHPLHSISITHD